MIPREERNYGVDMLRIVAMLMVCFVHINWYTKVHVDIYPDKEGLYYFGVWSQSAAIIGVNLYAMITGYVSVLSKWKFSRYVRLWLLVAFYTVFICGVGFILVEPCLEALFGMNPESVFCVFLMTGLTIAFIVLLHFILSKMKHPFAKFVING